MWRTYDGHKAPLQQALLSLLHELIEEEHIPSEVAVLTPFSHRTSQLKAESLRPTKEIRQLSTEMLHIRRWFNLPGKTQVAGKEQLLNEALVNDDSNGW